MPNKTRAVVRILHRYNQNTKTNVCTRHYGTRRLRNLRDIVVYGVRERIAEVIIHGSEEHVGVPIYGPAHIIDHRAWELVYGPADKLTAEPVGSKS